MSQQSTELATPPPQPPHTTGETKPGEVHYNTRQVANLRGFHPSVNPKFQGRILDFMDRSQTFRTILLRFNMVNKKLHWWNPKLKSLNSMPAQHYNDAIKNNDQGQVFFIQFSTVSKA